MDAITDQAVAAGGREARESAQDTAFMYSRWFEDLDGHIWGPLWMHRNKEGGTKERVKESSWFDGILEPEITMKNSPTRDNQYNIIFLIGNQMESTLAPYPHQQSIIKKRDHR